MNKPIRVLIFPCGKENGLEIYQSLRYAVNITVFGASSIRDHGAFVYENYISGVPFIQDDSFIDEFEKIINKNKIDLVIPTHDSVSLFLAKNRSLLSAIIVAPNVTSAQICRDKKLTYDILKGNAFLPDIFSLESVIHDNKFPVFVKPRIGEGGKNTMLCHNKDDLKKNIPREDDYLISEYLPGEELTVDCFTDKKGELLFVGPRSRNRVVNGISYNATRYSLTQEIHSIAKTIGESIPMRGLWYFQVKKDIYGFFKLLEVSCRTAGTMVFYRMLGVNFALLSVYDYLEYDVEVLFNNIGIELDRTIRNRFLLTIEFDVVYIDYDDTIIIKNLVNEMAIAFIYQMINQGKKIILITKHEGDIYTSLNKYRIAPNIFYEIIHLNTNQFKSGFIKSEKAILIDNDFKTRKEVHSILGIPVFDVDAIEGLIK
ncbi:MAG: ATP-grasp domain-containing protein [Leptospiraceae bacterium]|nr:ATP-grasp domain-containing protein [Leptospiraceae bacterium]